MLPAVNVGCGVRGMRGYHDIGGLPSGAMERGQHDYALWEKRVDAMLVLLSSKKLITTDELRLGIETLGAEAYERLSYYERWRALIFNTDGPSSASSSPAMLPRSAAITTPRLDW